MPDDTNGQVTKAYAETQSQLDHAERYRERFRRTQAIAAQKSRIGAAGDKLSDGAAAGMVADFLTRGGLVTVCPPAEATLNDAEDHHKRSG